MNFKIFLKDQYIFWPYIIVAMFLVAAFSAAYINLADINNLLIIHFDAFRGIDFLGERSDVFGILGVSAVILVLNGLLSYYLYARERFLAYLLSFGAPIFGLLILIAVVVIISIN